MGAAMHRFGLTRADVAVAGGLAAFGVFCGFVTPLDPAYRPFDATAVSLTVAVAVVVAWRRRHPLVVLVAAAAVLNAAAALGYDVVSLSWALWLAVYSLFAWRDDTGRYLGAALLAGGFGLYVALDAAGAGAMRLVGVPASYLAAALLGEAVRNRRAYVAELEGRDAAVARQGVLEERARLARELHDALGHTVNVMVLHAGVARRVFDANPAYAREVLEGIETSGRRALGELDRVLDLLRPDGGGDQHDPPATASSAPIARDGEPALAALDSLVAGVRAAGCPVELTTTVAADRVPAPVGTRVYRIVQEALTNVVKHAGSVPVSVRVQRVGDEIDVEVRDRGGPPGEGRGTAAGRGLANMGARAREGGGRFEAGPVDGGFRVWASLPLEPRAAPAAPIGPGGDQAGAV